MFPFVTHAHAQENGVKVRPTPKAAKGAARAGVGRGDGRFGGQRQLGGDGCFGCDFRRVKLLTLSLPRRLRRRVSRRPARGAGRLEEAVGVGRTQKNCFSRKEKLKSGWKLIRDSRKLDSQWS